MTRKVLVTGGAGYVGSLLVPQLLSQGCHVVVYDILWFGDRFLPAGDPRLTVIRGDIRNTDHLRGAVEGCDSVISLACVSNDASFELDEALSTTINLDAFEPMVMAAKDAGVRRFIYASSSSVYGVSEAPDVSETHPLVPLTLYNRFKAMCEPLLFRYMSDDFVCVTIRPATICGYAPRMRLDLTVNILTNLAVNKGEITVFGGGQLRPNLHVQDMCDLYSMLLEIDADRIQGEVFNCGYENNSIRDIAILVKRVVEEEFPERDPVRITTTPTDDIRSYHINSDKIRKRLGFSPKHSVEDAVRGICAAFKDGRIPNSLSDTHYYNVRRLKQLRAA
jgi:nucleoside-diphosphate-sugar epimerase